QRVVLPLAPQVPVGDTVQLAVHLRKQILFRIGTLGRHDGVTTSRAARSRRASTSGASVGSADFQSSSMLSYDARAAAGSPISVAARAAPRCASGYRTDTGTCPR